MSDRIAICDCDSTDTDDELFAKAHYDGVGRDVVIIRRDGTVTNRYADGVVGVTERDRQKVRNDPFGPTAEVIVQDATTND